jgi:cytochrome c oxidase subunit 3
VWPNEGPGALAGHFKTMGPWPIPTLNTALLLSSGVTLTISHHALRDDHRKKAIAWLAATLVSVSASCSCRASSTTTRTTN